MVVKNRVLSVFEVIVSLLLLVAVLVHISLPQPLFDQPTSTVMNDSSGELLSAKIAKDGQWRFPETDSLTDQFEKCLIAYEDVRFYRHHGVDFYAVGRAVIHNLRSKGRMQGASTLTMQLARMARNNPPRTFKNKLIEALWAFDIEYRYSKKDILRMYASHAPFGGNVVGIDAASWRYFDRDKRTLSWAENAMLAVLPNSPSLIHLGKNRTQLLNKRNRLLVGLNRMELIHDLRLALQEPLPDQPYPLPHNAPHYLMTRAQEHEGELIQTHIDARLQKLVQQLANDYSSRYHSSDWIDNIAVLILDVESGEPIVYVGNSTALGVEASYVDIIQRRRSPGSLLKPFLYTSMMSCGELLPRQLVSDTPLSLNGFTPSNYSKTYSGAVHADEAIQQSLNIPLVRLLSVHTVGRFMDDLKDLGMTTLTYSDTHYGASLILGGAEAKLWDLCRMYRSLALRLLYPSDYTSSDERFKPGAVWYAFQAMSNLNRPEEESEWQLFRTTKKVAWKTGTSWGNRDAWAIGVTQKYVVGVWVGNATGEGRAGMTGVGYAAPVLFDVFSLLLGSEWFEQPSYDMTGCKVCRKSGCLASAACEQVDEVRFLKSGALAKQCDCCRIVHLSKDEKYQVNSKCMDVDQMVKKKWFVLPPAQEYYYRQKHSDYQSLPPLHPDCADAVPDQIDFIYPEHNSVVVIPRGFSGEKESVVFRAVNRRSNARLFWHLDQSYIGTTVNDHSMTATLSEGTHILTIMDEEGNRRSISFSVR